MMPRLEAEQSLARISETAAGTGSMEQQAAKEYLAALRSDAQPRKRERAPRVSRGQLARLHSFKR